MNARRDSARGILDHALGEIGRKMANQANRISKAGTRVRDRRGHEYLIWKDGSLRRVDKLAASAAKKG